MYTKDPSIHLTIDSYPTQVNVGQNFDINGHLMRGGVGIPDVQIDHVGDAAQTLWTITTIPMVHSRIHFILLKLGNIMCATTMWWGLEILSTLNNTAAMDCL